MKICRCQCFATRSVLCTKCNIFFFVVCGKSKFLLFKKRLLTMYIVRSLGLASASTIVLMMEGVRASEMSVKFYGTIPRKSFIHKNHV